LAQLADANRGKRGFTFTHKYRRPENFEAIAKANASGFTINLSADSLVEADRLADLKIGPVAVVLPTDGVATYTPAGRKVIVCPAQGPAHLTCKECELCALPDRKAIVGFRAHGQGKLGVSDTLVRLRRKEELGQHG
jgi:hypothetical protein